MDQVTKNQRFTYTIVGFFFSLIIIGFLHGLNLVTNGLVLIGLIFLITGLVYTNPSLGRHLAKLWVSWSVIGSRGHSNPTGVKLATDIAQNKVSIDDKIEPRAAKVVILVIVGIIIAFIVFASLLT